MPFNQYARSQLADTLVLLELFNLNSDEEHGSNLIETIRINLIDLQKELSRIKRGYDYLGHNTYIKDLVSYTTRRHIAQFFSVMHKYHEAPYVDVSRMAYGETFDEKRQAIIYKNYYEKHVLTHLMSNSKPRKLKNKINHDLTKVFLEVVDGYNPRPELENGEDSDVEDDILNVMRVVELNLIIERLESEYRPRVRQIYKDFTQFQESYLNFASAWVGKHVFIIKFQKFLMMPVKNGSILPAKIFNSFVQGLQSLNQGKCDAQVDIINNCFDSLKLIRNYQMTSSQHKQLVAFLLQIKNTYSAYTNAEKEMDDLAAQFVFPEVKEKRSHTMFASSDRSMSSDGMPPLKRRRIVKGTSLFENHHPSQQVDNMSNDDEAVNNFLFG